ncbi:serine hydrolase domain-containing protein [Hyphobacterium marinum]|uniref:Serine hydrolase domain-containing protein n=1 Tax=Hyphobacterium marinum TaxID=3116574 RepID=A0ABU7LV13_9PROT|nr:serine hydrolase domain-containing protein [Hyphobacterium sp. Y6023]MEE2565388.1 serine hydrolase domain-containing protein [Hyphobacterium sp. Y6023]
MTLRYSSAIALLAAPILLIATPPALALDTACPAEPAAAPATELTTTLDTVLADAAADEFNGQLAIWQDGVWLYSGSVGFADRERTRPISGETLFELASTAKYLTAIMVLQAVDAGRIAVTDTVSPYLDGSAIAERGTTIEELLSHRSALGASYAAEAVYSNEAALAAIDAEDYDPARRGDFRYSNDGYNILGLLLERLHGRPYEALAYRDIIDPACLDHTGFWSEPGIGDPARLAQPAEGYPESLVGRNYGMIGASGYLASAADLVRLQAALLDDRLLSDASRAELFAPRIVISLGAASYGGFLVDDPHLGRFHSARGSNDWGTNAYLNTYFECGIILAVTTSSGRTGPDNRLYRDVITDAVTPLLEPYCPAEE